MLKGLTTAGGQMQEEAQTEDHAKQSLHCQTGLLYSWQKVSMCYIKVCGLQVGAIT